MADFTTPEAKKLGKILDTLKQELISLKGTGSSPQLGYSSIDVNEGRGYIPIIENGEIKMRIGRQPDGSIATVTEPNSNPIPPSRPYQPLCTSVLGGVLVRCQGFEARQFADFSFVKVYRDLAFVGTIIKVPGSFVVAPLTPGNHSFRLSAVNLSGTESPMTEGIDCAAGQAVGDDIADGIVTTLKIANEAITDAKVAVDAIHNQHIAAQAVGTTEITDGAITTDLIAANAITADQIAANAIVASKIAAEAIQAAAIAAEAVTTNKLAANAITSDKIAANAITALQIAANAITSTKIDAGAIDATKLAAQLILASTQIIVGTVTGARLVLDTQGLTQYNTRGDLVLQFGAQSNKSNYLTIIDPTDPSNALASIASDGSFAMTGLTANGTIRFNGVDIVKYLNDLPRGIVARGALLADTGVSAATVGIFELQCDIVAGRSYRISSSALGIPYNSGLGFVYVTYTTNGSIPTTNSPRVNQLATAVSSGYSDTAANDFNVYGLNTPTLNMIFNSTTTGRGRFLFYKQAAILGGKDTFGLVAPIQFWIEDLGAVYAATGGSNPGGGTSFANGAYVSTFPCIYSGYAYDTNPDQGNGFGGPNQMFGAGTYQGYLNGTNYYSRLDFNFSAIQSTLAGSTIYKVELFLYSYYWALSTGGYVSIGTHNSSQVGTAYSFFTRNNLEAKMAKPDGQWITLPNNIGTALRDNTIKGLVLDARTSQYNSTTNYGQFRRGNSMDGADVQPVLRVTYVK